MTDELREVKLSEVVFIQKLKESKPSVVFQVNVRGRRCVMKVVCEPSYLVSVRPR